MLAVETLTLDRFLPLARMQELAESGYSSYIKATPFPHVVFDDFFDPQLLELVLAEFPQPGAIRWQRFDNEREIKLASAAESTFGPATRLLLYHLNSITFLNFLSDTSRTASAYTPENHARLRDVKAEWDPDNFFSFGHHIRPARITRADQPAALA